MFTLLPYLGNTPYVSVGALALATLGLGAFARFLVRPRAEPTTYRVQYRCREVMTPTELKFFHRLVEALPEAVVAPQVAMSALVDVPERKNQSEHAFVYRSKFAQQRLDYVVFNRRSGEVMCTVELDDHTHDNPKQQRKDWQRNAILESAGYTVVRFDARNMPSARQLRSKLRL